MGIHIENIRRGMGLLVLRGPMKKKFAQYGGEMIGEVEDRSLHGYLLAVRAVSPPYVLCRKVPIASSDNSVDGDSTSSPYVIYSYFHTSNTPSTGDVLIDTRQYSLAAASQALMASALPKPDIEKMNKADDEAKAWTGGKLYIEMDGKRHNMTMTPEGKLIEVEDDED